MIDAISSQPRTVDAETVTSVKTTFNLFPHDMMGGAAKVSADLIGRITIRAEDSKTRTDVPDISSLGTEKYALKVGNIFKILVAGFNLPSPEPASPERPTSLAMPVSAEELAQAEQRLGFSLPEELTQLYKGVADGGFGPGGGLAPLNAAIAHYQDLTANPPGELGQIWPPHLFPINLWDLGADCYDLKSGEIVHWDEESLLDGPSNRVWRRSFKKIDVSLSTYLESWLAKTPPTHDRFIKAAEAGFSEATGEIDTHIVEHLRKSIEILSTQTAEQRAIWGLPDEGWEEALCEAQGIDPKVYLQLIKLPRVG